MSALERIGLVLDASAISAFPSLDVGETITQVAENGAAFTVPWPALAAVNADDRWLKFLLGHPAHQPAEIPWTAWPQMRAMTEVLGSPAAAAALWLATSHDCLILTGDPSVWAPLGDDPPIVIF